jgi:hypothetical protein
VYLGDPVFFKVVDLVVELSIDSVYLTAFDYLAELEVMMPLPILEVFFRVVTGFFPASPYSFLADN